MGSADAHASAAIIRQLDNLPLKPTPQLESGDTAMLSFEPIAINDLRKNWLEHHEHVLRSSINTINRYRTATDHLLSFIRDVRGIRVASNFTPTDAEAFVRYLRTVEVAPNGHVNSKKRRLLDKGVTFIVDCCRTLFMYAAKRRHLSAYAENPFTAINASSIPVENAKPIVLFTPEQERAFLEACDDRQFPIFLTLMLTGVRPGELCHLLLPDDLDLDNGILKIRNKPGLGWQIKTRAERTIPLVPELCEVLRAVLNGRSTGPVFRQSRCGLSGYRSKYDGLDQTALERSAVDATAVKELELRRSLDRCEQLSVRRKIWRDLAALKEDRLRIEFIALAKTANTERATAPKALRHSFATMLQSSNVDPLVRNLLMGHSAGRGRSGAGLGMTAAYTHTQPSTIRQQLEASIASRAAVTVAREWISKRIEAF